ncbi:hypothetical protein QJQ45_011394 [Haematococcus lacustris]|nr:hypothetical protein QJQ45_011394 [Haematococcus lacustris]
MAKKKHEKGPGTRNRKVRDPSRLWATVGYALCDNPSLLSVPSQRLVPLKVIKVPEGAVLRGCKKTRRKLREHLRLRAEIHSQLRFIASLFVLRIFLTCLVGYPTPGFPSAPQPPAVQPPQPPDAPPLPPLPPRAPAQPPPAQPASMEFDTDSDSESDCDSDPEPQSDSEQLKDFCKFFANPNFKTCYNQLQRRLVRKGQRRHPMLMPVIEDPSKQALLAKLQELGTINLSG